MKKTIKDILFMILLTAGIILMSSAFGYAVYLEEGWSVLSIVAIILFGLLGLVGIVLVNRIR